jgi:hypothetical protein
VSARTAFLVLVFAFALSVTGLAAAVTRSQPAERAVPHRFVPAAKLLGHRRHKLPKATITLTDQMWVCDSPVDLDSVTVTMTPSFPSRRGGDAIHLENGCTGRIGRLTVVTSIADGVKVAQGAHDLTVGGGSIRCLAKLSVVHQDGIQVMGGTRITFRRLRVDCGRPGSSLIDSNLFIKESGRSTSPPTDVVCVDCYLGPDAAHTVNIQRSLRSGVRSSTLCTAKYPQLTLDVGRDAVEPVTAGDSVGAC